MEYNGLGFHVRERYADNVGIDTIGVFKVVLERKRRVISLILNEPNSPAVASVR